MRRPIVFESKENRCFGCGGPGNPARLGSTCVGTAGGCEVEPSLPQHVQGMPAAW